MGSLAILIDADNIGAGSAPAIMRRARLWGDSSIVRVFGDFTANRHAEWCDLARIFGYELVLQLNGGRGKNSTDIALTIHAMDLLHNGSIDSFCLVSNDRDFLPLAARLRGAGKKVHVICQKLDERMTSAFTSVVALSGSELSASKRSAPPPAELPQIVTAFLAVSGGRSELTLAETGSLLRKHAPKLFEGVSKNGSVRKLLDASGRFDVIGEGNSLRVRLKAS